MAVNGFATQFLNGLRLSDAQSRRNAAYCSPSPQGNYTDSLNDENLKCSCHKFGLASSYVGRNPLCVGKARVSEHVVRIKNLKVVIRLNSNSNLPSFILIIAIAEMPVPIWWEQAKISQPIHFVGR